MKEVSTDEVKGRLTQDKDEAELSKLMRLAIGGVLIALNCGDDNGMHVVM